MLVLWLVGCVHPETTPPLVARDPGFSLPDASRIEGVELAGECAADGDCTTAGCSAEVCVAASRAPGVVTTCERLPSFLDLKACTCQDGLCRWVHETGARGTLAPLPGLLPAADRVGGDY